MATEQETYNIGFTAGAAMLNEMQAVAGALLDCNGDWEKTKDKTFKENLMVKDKMSSNVRYFALMKQRLEVLNETEITLLVNGTASVRRLIVLLAICKAHSFVYDFISENVRECSYNQYEKVTQANFNEFFNEKKYIHPELEAVTDQTIAKMKQVVFRILEQLEIIESVNLGLLQRPYLPESVERAIVKDDPKWLSAFLYSNNEISNAISLYEE